MRTRSAAWFDGTVAARTAEVVEFINKELLRNYQRLRFRDIQPLCAAVRRLRGLVRSFGSEKGVDGEAL